MALGCTGMSVRGKKIAVCGSDFEFTLPESSAAAPKLDAIWRPMKPLKILPESDVFAGEQEITFACDEPGAVMTYTLDGSDPTPQSTRYAGPFTIDRSYVIKGRAYRPGVAANPSDMSSTHATPATYAKYTRQLYCEAENGDWRTPGVNYEYCEGYWKDLWLLADRQTAKEKGAVATLFDMSLIPARNKRLGDKLAPREHAYSFKYTGFLKVPEDGVYTIHAPREYVHPEQIAGYELQVYLGHSTSLDQARRAEFPARGNSTTGIRQPVCTAWARGACR